MPINELEIHPFIDSIIEDDYRSDYFDSLIIGSFPIYSITSTLNTDLTENERFDNQNAFMRFYYGSNKNKFWELFSSIFSNLNPKDLDENENIRKEYAISILVQNRFLITDVILKTNRNNYNSEDSELWIDTVKIFVNENRQLNHNISNLLNRNINIKYLYFTSTEINGKSPFGWFKEIFRDNLSYEITQQVGNRVICARVLINGRKYIAFFLPSPAGKGFRGLHYSDNRKTQIFENYINSVDPNFQNEIRLVNVSQRSSAQKRRLTQLRNEFLFESYRQALLYRNINFNGVV